MVEEALEDCCAIRYMKRISKTNKFIFPEKEERYTIDYEDIVTIINNEPNINNREQYVFHLEPKLLEGLE